MDTIYLDHNATTPTRPEVVEAMVRCYAQCYANPASQHRPGQQAHRVLEDARERIAAILGADLTCPQPDRLIFTASGTEANNLAVLGIARAAGIRKADSKSASQHESASRADFKSASQHELVGMTDFKSAPQHERAAGVGQIIISAVEHQNVIEPAEYLLEQGWRLDTLRVTPEGVVRPEDLPPLLGEQTRLVSVIWGNHETGVIQPVARLAQISNDAGVFFHTDAVQTVGKIPVDFRASARPP